MSENTSHRKIGRVLIELSAGTPNTIALHEAMAMAHALDSEIEGLFITDQELEYVTRLTAARTLSASGRKVGQDAARTLKREIFLASRSMQRQFDELAEAAKLRHRFRTIEGQPIEEMCRACADDEKASLLVLSETLALGHINEIDVLLTQPSNLSGLLMVGPGALRRSGPAVIVPDDMAGVEAMLEMAQALISKDKPIIIFLAGDDDHALSQNADQLHATLQPDERLNILSAKIPGHQPQVMTDAIMRLKGGLVIAQYGGALLPAKTGIMPLATALACPLLITR